MRPQIIVVQSVHLMDLPPRTSPYYDSELEKNLGYDKQCFAAQNLISILTQEYAIQNVYMDSLDEQGVANANGYFDRIKAWDIKRRHQYGEWIPARDFGFGRNDPQGFAYMRQLFFLMAANTNFRMVKTEDTEVLKRTREMYDYDYLLNADPKAFVEELSVQTNLRDDAFYSNLLSSYASRNIVFFGRAHRLERLRSQDWIDAYFVHLDGVDEIVVSGELPNPAGVANGYLAKRRIESQLKDGSFSVKLEICYR